MCPDPNFVGQHWSELLPDYEIIMRSISGSSNGIIAYQFFKGLELEPDAVVMGFTAADRIEFLIPQDPEHDNRTWYSSGNSALNKDQKLAVDLFRATSDDGMNTFKSCVMARCMFLECERRKIPYAFNLNALHGANVTAPNAPLDPLVALTIGKFFNHRCSNLNGYHTFKMSPGYHTDDPVWQQRMADEAMHILSQVDFD